MDNRIKIGLASLVLALSSSAISNDTVSNEKTIEPPKQIIKTTSEDNSSSENTSTDKATQTSQAKAQQTNSEDIKGSTKEKLEWLGLADSMWKDGMGHLILSPLSLGEALSTARKVSSGNAQLGLNVALEQLSADEICTGPGLNSANKVIVSNKLPVVEFLPGYIEKVDLSKQKSIDEINHWVSESTNNKIDQILTEPLPDTDMVVLNALYFASKWAEAFDVEKTQSEPFYNTESSTVDVPMMNATEISVGYSDLGDIHGINLPFRNGRYSYVAFTGKEYLPVKKVLSLLQSSGITAAIKSAKDMEINLKIPRHELATDTDWADSLKSTSLSAMFESDRVNFAGITPKPMGINAVLQKARITIDEQGAMAAAVTAMLAGRSLAETISVSFNKPFIEMIIDNKNPELPVIIGLIEQFTKAEQVTKKES